MSWKNKWEQRGNNPNPLEAVYGSMKPDYIDQTVGMIVQTLNLTKKDDLLDVACGNALILEKLADKTRSITGVDFSHNMLEKARERVPQAQFIEAEANKLPFNDNSFTKTFCNNAFQYFPSNEYARQALREMERVTTKKILISSIPRKDWQEQIFFMKSNKNYWKAPYRFLRYVLFNPNKRRFYDEKFFSGWQITENDFTEIPRFNAIFEVIK